MLAARKIWFVSTFVIVLACLVFALVQKGIWYDEIYSVFMGRHDLPLSQTYRQRWAFDVHPPLFSFIAWLFEPVTGESIVAKRMINLIPLIIAASGLVFIGRARPNSWIAVASLLVLANPVSFDFFVQHRPYFIFIAAWSVACAALAAIENTDFRSEDRSFAAILSCAIIVSLNVQFLCAFFAAVMTTPFILIHWLAGRRKWATIIFLSVAIGSVLIVFQAALQFPQLAEAKQHFWATTSFLGAVRAVAEVLVFSALANVAALIGLYFARTTGLRHPFVIPALISIVLVVAAAIALNFVRPIIIRQYVSPLFPMTVILIAVGGSSAVLSRKWLTVAVLTNVVIVTAAYSYRRAQVQDEDRLAAFIGKSVAACRETKVIGVPHWTMRADGMFVYRNEREVVANGYRMLGHKYGFQLANADAETSTKCPTILWAEKFDGSIDPEAAAKRAGLKTEGFEFKGASRVSSETGVAYIFPRR